MKNSTINLMLIFCLSPFLLQCVATQKDMNSTNLRIRAINQRITAIDHDFVELKNKTMEKVQKRQAKVSDQIDNQQDEILRLKGLLEESAHQNRMLREENKEYKTTFNSEMDGFTNALTNKIAILEKRISQIETNIENTIKEIEDIKQSRAREAAERAMEAAKTAEKAKAKVESIQITPPEITPEQTKKKVNKQSQKNTATTPKTTKKSITAANRPVRNIYEHALSQFNAGKSQEAYDSFAEYLDKSPKGKMAANARLMMGDALYKQKKYELAILEYQRVIADFPYYLKAPAAMLKQAEAFEKINDASTAKIVYKKLLSDYPKSNEIKTAKARLQKIK